MKKDITSLLKKVNKSFKIQGEAVNCMKELKELISSPEIPELLSSKNLAEKLLDITTYIGPKPNINNSFFKMKFYRSLFGYTTFTEKFLEKIVFNISNINEQVLELGSGYGMLAFLLSKLHQINIIATGQNPNSFDGFNLGLPVENLEASAAVDKYQQTKNCESFTEALKRFKGNTIIYIGEGRGGVCAPKSFFDEMEKQGFKKQHQYRFDTWDKLDDALIIFKKQKI